MNPYRTTLTALALIVLSGCENLPTMEEIRTGEWKNALPTAQRSDESPPPAGSRKTGNLRDIVAQLQDGQFAQARVALAAYLVREPQNQTARSLLRQLDTDPVALLGESYTLYTVERGDTLGELAARNLGDAVNFVALARYNDIARPRALAVGQRLKIPTSQAGARELAADPRDDLVTMPAPIPVEPQPAAPEEAADATANDETAPPPASEGSWRSTGTVSVQDESERVAELHQTAIVHYRNQQLDEAIALWDRVLVLDPGFEPARGYRTRALELKRRLNALEPR